MARKCDRVFLPLLSRARWRTSLSRPGFRTPRCVTTSCLGSPTTSRSTAASWRPALWPLTWRCCLAETWLRSARRCDDDGRLVSCVWPWAHFLLECSLPVGASEASVFAGIDCVSPSLRASTSPAVRGRGWAWPELCTATLMFSCWTTRCLLSTPTWQNTSSTISLVQREC